jgi:hypothetical protein
MALFVLGSGLGGCASSSGGANSLTLAFVDPARYDLYDCTQLEAERKGIAKRIDDLHRLMAKADTGFAGPVVAELAYRNDLLAAEGQSTLADQVWRRDKCHDSPPTPVRATPVPSANAGGTKRQVRSRKPTY